MDERLVSCEITFTGMYHKTSTRDTIANKQLKLYHSLLQRYLMSLHNNWMDSPGSDAESYDYLPYGAFYYVRILKIT
jgi:hypothetical protein